MGRATGSTASNPPPEAEAPSAPSVRAPAPSARPAALPKASIRPAERYLGQTVDRRYVVKRLLSRGGMGAVYLCRRTVIDRLVAMKVLRAELMHDPESTERFIIEAKAASAIGSPHIVEVFDFGTMPDGCTYFVMEYLEGDSLGKVLERDGHLTPDRAIHIAKQIAEGLAAAHDVDIVHRDLKPDNVVLIQRDSGEFVKILDFGLAKVARPQGRLTRVGKVFGTPHYMSPEQSRGKPVDLRTDVYALGVMLYEMLSGRVPFEGDTPLSILAGHVHGNVKPLRTHDSPAREVSAELEAVVLKCLAKRPEHRYPSLRALHADLELVEQGQAPGALRDRASGEQDLGNVEALVASLEEWEEEEEEAHSLVDAADESDVSLTEVDDPEDTVAGDSGPEASAHADDVEPTLVDSNAPPADDEAADAAEPAGVSAPETKRSAVSSRPAPPTPQHPRLWPLGVGVLVLLGVLLLLLSRVQHELRPAISAQPSAETEPVASASAPSLSGEVASTLPSEAVASALPPVTSSEPATSAAPSVEASSEPIASAIVPVEALSTGQAASRWVMIAIEPEDAEIYCRGIKLGTPPLPIEVKEGEPLALEARRRGYWPNRFKVDGSKSRVSLRMAPILRKPSAAAAADSANPDDT
jgi:serine/threonine protein kinase